MNESKKQAPSQDQFKSTKKWNEIIDSFYGQMPLKRHWKNFRTFNDCFTASEAIDWIYRFLKTSPNFQHLNNITRQNAIKLLQIYLKERIIEDVRSSENFTIKEFQDDDRIYRFCTSNPILANRNSTKSNSSAISSESKALNANETSNELSINNKNLFENNTQTIKNCEIVKEKPNNKSLNTTSLENLSTANPNPVRKRNSSPILKHGETVSRQDIITKPSSSSFESEIWSKIARKMLESIMRKSILHSNPSKCCSPRYDFNYFLKEHLV